MPQVRDKVRQGAALLILTARCAVVLPPKRPELCRDNDRARATARAMARLLATAEMTAAIPF